MWIIVRNIMSETGLQSGLAKRRTFPDTDKKVLYGVEEEGRFSSRRAQRADGNTDKSLLH